jgi:hypothetical protein
VTRSTIRPLHLARALRHRGGPGAAGRQDAQRGEGTDSGCHSSEHGSGCHHDGRYQHRATSFTAAGEEADFPSYRDPSYVHLIPSQPHEPRRTCR